MMLEEKQDLLKKLDTIPADKKEKLKEVLAQEFESFQKLDDMALHAIKSFTQSLQLIKAEH